MNREFFQNNRQKLKETLANSIVVVSAYSTMQRGNDASFSFEQEANFWYLAGIEASDWQLIIDGEKSWLVAPNVDDVRQIFDGSLSYENAKKQSGVDGVISITEARTLLKELATRHDVVYTIGPDPYAKHYDFTMNPAQKKLHTQLKKAFSEVRDCRVELAMLRAVKQPVEIVAMKNAINLTVESFKNIKQQIPHMRYEYEVEAAFTYAFRKNGATGHAYDPIVASGNNACTLHYNRNQQKLQNNSLLLIDIGARVDGYAADVTRTYAIGTPTQRQVDVHHSVEVAHKTIIALLHPGLSVVDYQAQVDHIMQDALMNLGLLTSRTDAGTYRKYFPHAISHGLGIDVHDSLGRPTHFAEGMVLTVEPGIYIPEENIGVRIEDDILITATGAVNLSGALDTSL